MNQNNVGHIIQEKRREKGLTQKQLSELLHVSSTAVSKWERNVNTLNTEIAQDISKILEIPLELLTETKNDTQTAAPKAEPLPVAPVPDSPKETPEADTKASSPRKKSFAALAIAVIICLSAALSVELYVHHAKPEAAAGQDIQGIDFRIVTDFWQDSDYGYTHYVIVEYDGTMPDSFKDNYKEIIRTSYPELLKDAEFLVLLFYDSYDAEVDTYFSADYIFSLTL